MSITRLKDRETGGSIIANDDDDEFDGIISEVNSHTAAANPHSGSLAKTVDSITGIHSFGSDGYFNNMKIKTHDDYSGSEFYTYTYPLATTNATETSLTTWTLTDLYHYAFDASVVCHDGAGTQYAFFRILYTADRASTTVAEKMGNVVLAQVRSTSTMNCFFDTSALTVRLRVIGKASTTLKWVGVVSWHALKTNA